MFVSVSALCGDKVEWLCPFLGVPINLRSSHTPSCSFIENPCLQQSLLIVLVLEFFFPVHTVPTILLSCFFLFCSFSLEKLWWFHRFVQGRGQHYVFLSGGTRRNFPESGVFQNPWLRFGDPTSVLAWWGKEGSGWDRPTVVWDGPAPASMQQHHHLRLGKSPSSHLGTAGAVGHTTHSWAGAEPSSSSPRQAQLCSSDTTLCKTSSLLKGMMSGPDFNLLYVVYVLVGEVIPAVYTYIWEEPMYNVYIYMSSVVAAGLCHTEVSEHQVLLSLGLLVSLDSFCVCDDLWMGTSEAIKMILDRLFLINTHKK